jgi:predicted metal-binding transcription factor (methanogenesis marker protein 9)
MSKLTEQELKEFNTAREGYFDTKSKLADLTINEERIKRQKTSTLANVELAYEALAKIQNEIHAKYGEVSVDFKTGEIDESN